MSFSNDKKQAKARSFVWKSKMVLIFAVIGFFAGGALGVAESGKKLAEFVFLNRVGASISALNLGTELGHFSNYARIAHEFFLATKTNPVLEAAIAKITNYGIGGAILFFAGSALALIDRGGAPEK